MEQPKYQRVLLKLSGEALAGEAGRGIDFPFVRQVCQVVKACASRGVQVGLVVGGGNYWRGVKDGGGQMCWSRWASPPGCSPPSPWGRWGRSSPGRQPTGTSGRGKW